MEIDALADKIYEAAVIPEYWPGVLDWLGELGESDAASLIAFGRDDSIRYISTPNYEAAFSDYVANGSHLPNRRPVRALELVPMAFAHDLEVCSQEELDADPIYRRFALPYGFGWTAGTVVPVPSGDVLVYDLARKVENGPFVRQQMERLDPLRPHLARAALLSYRLQMKVSSGAAEALGILGLPAAVIAADRTVLASNEGLAALAPRIRIGAFDRIYLQSKPADTLLGDALAAPIFDGIRSIPLAATEQTSAMVAHLVPIRRAAHDIFSRATVLLMVTLVDVPSAPLTEVLTGLFDLTPAEARVARGISTGQTVEELATSSGRSVETVRTQLKSLMLKTGTSRQVELAVLLSGIRPFQAV